MNDVADLKNLLGEVSVWMHNMLDRPPQTPDAVSILRRIDDALKSDNHQPSLSTSDVFDRINDAQRHAHEKELKID